MKKNRIKKLVKEDWAMKRFFFIKLKYKQTNNEEGD